MAAGGVLRIDVEPREVTLHYPGAEGVVFEDAVLVLRNTGTEPLPAFSLRLAVEQDGKGMLLDGEVTGQDLGVGDPIAAGGEVTASLFRLLQKKNQGFASRVNLFGFKAAVGWDFRVAASAAPASETKRWSFRWEKDPEQPDRVRLEWK